MPQRLATASLLLAILCAAPQAPAEADPVIDARYMSGGGIINTFDELLVLPPGESTAGTLTFSNGMATLAITALLLEPAFQARVNLGGTFPAALETGATGSNPVFLRRYANTGVEPPEIREWKTDPSLIEITLTEADLATGRVAGEFRVHFDAGETLATYWGTFDAPVRIIGAAGP